MKTYRITLCKKFDEDFTDEFIKNIRLADYEEITSFTNDVKQELKESIENSLMAYIVQGESGEPLAMFGITHIEDMEGFMIWCVGTNYLIKYRREFIIMSRCIIETWRKKYRLLYNCVSAENKQAITWLKHLNAVFSEKFTIGKRNKKFMKFVIAD